jgi:HEAT repeat protein
VLKTRDQRAAPLFGYLVRQMDRRQFPQLYLTAIEVLGQAGGADAVETLKTALHAGGWWTPISNRKYRSAAAHALSRIATAEALDVLRAASTRGALGVRLAARAELGSRQ